MSDFSNFDLEAALLQDTDLQGANLSLPTLGFSDCSMSFSHSALASFIYLAGLCPEKNDLKYVTISYLSNTEVRFTIQCPKASVSMTMDSLVDVNQFDPFRVNLKHLKELNSVGGNISFVYKDGEWGILFDKDNLLPLEWMKCSHFTPLSVSTPETASNYDDFTKSIKRSYHISASSPKFAYVNSTNDFWEVHCGNAVTCFNSPFIGDYQLTYKGIQIISRLLTKFAKGTSISYGLSNGHLEISLGGFIDVSILTKGVPQFIDFTPDVLLHPCTASVPYGTFSSVYKLSKGLSDFVDCNLTLSFISSDDHLSGFLDLGFTYTTTDTRYDLRYCYFGSSFSGTFSLPAKCTRSFDHMDHFELVGSSLYLRYDDCTAITILDLAPSNIPDKVKSSDLFQGHYNASERLKLYDVAEKLCQGTRRHMTSKLLLSKLCAKTAEVKHYSESDFVD